LHSARGELLASRTKARQLGIVEKIFNKNRSIIHHMGIFLLILPFTLVMLVLLLSTLFYLQPREFRGAFALVPCPVDSLINSLSVSGFNSQLVVDRPNTSLFPLKADYILEFRADGETIIVYEYTNDTNKSVEASLISPDGTTYATKGKVTVEDYAAPISIHFYKGENLILKYVGNNTRILSSLGNLYGNQFAGSKLS
jgi:hypothetical protein